MEQISEKFILQLKYWGPVVLWMGMIFLFSSQTASESSQLSEGLLAVILDTMSNFFQTIPLSDHLLRKMAHFTIYAILGLLVMRAYSQGRASTPSKLMISFVLCAAYAATDEFHQLFVMGRGAQITDVVIDSLGSALGVVSYTFMRGAYRKRELRA